MSFDWRKFFEDQGIEYVEQGPNVARGNINIKCPFCGDADRSHHLGVNLTNGYWGCWRSPQHRGRSPRRLLRQFVSPQRVEELLGKRQHDLSRWDEIAQNGPFHKTKEAKAPPPKAKLPEGCRDIALRKYHGLAFKYYDYLKHARQFEQLTLRAIRRYDLRFCFKGDYKGRIIIPYYEEGKMVTFNSRSIHPDASLKYRTPRQDEAMRTTDCLFNVDHCTGAECLVIVEGPFDCMRLDVVSDKYFDGALHCVALSTLTMSERQLYILRSLLFPLYSRKIVVLDPGLNEALRATEIREALTTFGQGGASVWRLDGTKDLGGHSNQQLVRLITRLLNET